MVSATSCVLICLWFISFSVHPESCASATILKQRGCFSAIKVTLLILLLLITNFSLPPCRHAHMDVTMDEEACWHITGLVVRLLWSHGSSLCQRLVSFWHLSLLEKERERKRKKEKERKRNVVREEKKKARRLLTQYSVCSDFKMLPRRLYILTLPLPSLPKRASE
jgi:hypothetical protein